MSWDADFYAKADGHLVPVGDWDYTHNCDRMVAKVLTTVGYEIEGAFWDKPEQPTYWINHLNGLSGEDGAKFLALIVGGLNEAPEFFREMNPENGWGDYDSLVKTLDDMRACSEKYPTGVWSAS